MHGRRIGIVAVLVAFVLGWAGCTRDRPIPRDPDRYYNDAVGYSVRFPSKDYKFRVDVVREANQPKRPMELEPFIESRLNLLRRTLRGFQEVAREPATLGGRKAIRVTYVYQQQSPAGPMGMVALAYFTVRGHRGYILTCREQSIAFSRFRVPLERIAASFEFISQTED